MNYEQAIKKAGGDVLYNGNRGLFGKLVKGGDTWWIKVNTDGSGWYWYESIKETSMRQDVLLNETEMAQLLKNEGKITFYNIYFDTDQSAVKPASAPALQSIAAFLKANPTVVVFVVGHTDNTGSVEKNMTLSKDRATETVSALVSSYQVNKTQLLPQGVGPLCPVGNNSTENGKAKNRRVEIVLAGQ
jgi:outer membrane protein OmpA-like peptidoglycan-associated protein